MPSDPTEIQPVRWTRLLGIRAIRQNRDPSFLRLDDEEPGLLLTDASNKHRGGIRIT